MMAGNFAIFYSVMPVAFLVASCTPSKECGLREAQSVALNKMKIEMSGDFSKNSKYKFRNNNTGNFEFDFYNDRLIGAGIFVEVDKRCKIVNFYFTQ